MRFFGVWSSREWRSYRKWHKHVYATATRVLIISWSFRHPRSFWLYTVFLNSFEQTTHKKYLDSLSLVLHALYDFGSYSDPSHSSSTNSFFLWFLLAVVIWDRFTDDVTKYAFLFVCLFVWFLLVLLLYCSTLTKFLWQ